MSEELKNNTTKNKEINSEIEEKKDIKLRNDNIENKKETIEELTKKEEDLEKKKIDEIQNSDLEVINEIFQDYNDNYSTICQNELTFYMADKRKNKQRNKSKITKLDKINFQSKKSTKTTNSFNSKFQLNQKKEQKHFSLLSDDFTEKNLITNKLSKKHPSMSKIDFGSQKLCDLRMNYKLNLRKKMFEKRLLKKEKFSFSINKEETEKKNETLIKLIDEWRNYPEDDNSFFVFNYYYLKNNMKKVEKEKINNLLVTLFNKINLNEDFMNKLGFNLSSIVLLNEIFLIPHLNIRNLSCYFNCLKQFYLNFLKNNHQIQLYHRKIRLLQDCITNFIKFINLKDLLEILISVCHSVNIIFETFFSHFFYEYIEGIDSSIKDKFTWDQELHESFDKLFKAYQNIFQKNDFLCFEVLMNLLIIKLCVFYNLNNEYSLQTLIYSGKTSVPLDYLQTIKNIDDPNNFEYIMKFGKN